MLRVAFLFVDLGACDARADRARGLKLDAEREDFLDNVGTREDDGDDSDDSNKEHYPPFAMPKKMTNFKWVLGVRFGTKDEFKEAITNYVI
ncbi:hypothetical protein MTR_2g086110 [Medicago truncatula]|uniref:Uncharacterized protein n=1 Tax=Medicago truncatula TaxID=3880 RepID=G7ITP6_MEDTR|nr:hypothetical protein MTR_2g086110 [Medicago truncatula]